MRNRLVLLLVLATVVINALALTLLPDVIGIQFGPQGLTNFVPTAAYVFLAPGVLALAYLGTRDQPGRATAAAVIITVANLAIIITNLLR
jgi:hypothetical protein